MINIDRLNSSAPDIDHERIAQLEARWDDALTTVAEALYPDKSADNLPIEALAQESESRFVRQPNTQLLIGIAGPGAAGKGTLSRYFAEELGYNKVVNTTTRARREGENHGEDYYFVDHDQFSTAQNLGHFALALERIGRGMYGITHDEISDKLSTATGGCIVEENPENILELFANIDSETTQAILLYVLPNYPIVRHSLDRLRYRLSQESDPAKRSLTPDVFESTLGDRQIDEFCVTAELPRHPNVTPVFIINDDLEQTKAKLATMFGDDDAGTRN